MMLSATDLVLISGAPDAIGGESYTLNLTANVPVKSWIIEWGDESQTVLGDPSSVTHNYSNDHAIYQIEATATIPEIGMEKEHTHEAVVSNGGMFLDTLDAANVGGLSEPKFMTFGPLGGLYVSSFGTNEILICCRRRCS